MKLYPTEVHCQGPKAHLVPSPASLASESRETSHLWSNQKVTHYEAEGCSRQGYHEYFLSSPQRSFRDATSLGKLSKHKPQKTEGGTLNFREGVCIS